MPASKKKQAPIVEEIDLEDAEELVEVSEGLSLPIRKKNKGGRPPKYRQEYAKAAGVMLRRGATIGELAEAFDVTNETIRAWRIQHPEFSAQFSGLPEEPIKERIVRSLVELATGYTQDTVKVFMYKGVPVIVPVREQVAPSFPAIKHYLSVKDPSWRIKEELEVSGDEAFKAIWQKMADKAGEKE